ncbi:MAG: DJ-1/PfpI family protein [Chitinispirillaceae bacterium]|nr:DJ-1/PfpI family protein [Chitinispirillaceae bacterium]
MPNIITILAPGFEETEAITYIDLLRRAKISITLLGLNAREVKGSHDVTLIADAVISDFTGRQDGIILPGGMPGSRNLAESPRVLELVRETHERGQLCAAICAAPLVFGKAGILQGVKATCYPGFEKELVGATVTEQPLVRDRHIITARGVGAAISFGLELISYLADQEQSERIRTSILYAK